MTHFSAAELSVVCEIFHNLLGIWSKFEVLHSGIGRWLKLGGGGGPELIVNMRSGSHAIEVRFSTKAPLLKGVRGDCPPENFEI